MSVKKSAWDREVEDTPQETEERPPKFTSTYERGRGASWFENPILQISLN